MKSYTDIEQSEKLVEILSIESADMWFHPYPNDEYWYDVPNIGKANLKYNELPCWSLTALLEVMPKEFGRYTKTLYWFDDAWHCDYMDEDSESKIGVSADNPVDACVEMICRLETKSIDEKNIKELIENDGGKLKNIAKGDFVIPNSVTSIGNWAFRECCELHTITIPESVTTIGNYAFYECKHLTGITLPNSVSSISEGAFYGCTALTSVTIPNSVTSISNSMFEGCSRLTSVTIPNSVISIGNYTFQGCKSLTNIAIPDSITEIGYGAFMWCENLTSIIIPVGSRAKFEQLLPQKLHRKLKEQSANNLSENEL